MPTTRESLLDAARAAVEKRPWQVVRMIEVAASAGVSRQTLYNEFGDKAGLGSALVRRQLAVFLDGFSDGLAAGVRASRTPGADADEMLARAAGWVVRTARRDWLVRACLTGCRCTGLPAPAREPGLLVAELRDRALRTLAPHATGREAELAERCESAIRLAVSHLVAPPPAAAGEPTAGPAGTADSAGAVGAVARTARHHRLPPGPRPAPGGAAQSPSRRSRVASSRRSE